MREKLTPFVYQNLRNSESYGEQILNIINNILDTAKAQINELEFGLVETLMKEILEKIWRVTSQMLKEKRLNGNLKIDRNIGTNTFESYQKCNKIYSRRG